jgi:hypothetical protein
MGPITIGLKRARLGAGILAGLLGALTAGAAKDLEVSKQVGEYQVVMRIDRNPPVKGDNGLEVTITDGSGKAVLDARVLVNYYMPPMPRMPPMNYRKEAKPKKDKYGLKMDLIMEGPWIILMKITVGEKNLTAKFHVEVV